MKLYQLFFDNKRKIYEIELENEGLKIKSELVLNITRTFYCSTNFK